MDGKNSSLDLANLSLKTGKLQLNSAASIPAEKKSGEFFVIFKRKFMCVKSLDSSILG